MYEQVKRALQDVIAPELKGIQVEIKRLDEKIESMRQVDMKRLAEKIESIRNELLSEIKRLDEKIDGLSRELKVAIEIRKRLAALEAKIGA